jgi:hypothetical protein
MFRVALGTKVPLGTLTQTETSLRTLDSQSACLQAVTEV